MEKKKCYFCSIISSKGNLYNDKTLETLIKLHITRCISSGYDEFFIDLTSTGVYSAPLQKAKEIFPHININCLSSFSLNNVTEVGINKVMLVTDYQTLPKSILKHARENTIDLIVLNCNNYNVTYYILN